MNAGRQRDDGAACLRFVCIEDLPSSTALANVDVAVARVQADGNSWILSNAAVQLGVARIARDGYQEVARNLAVTRIGIDVEIRA